MHSAPKRPEAMGFRGISASISMSSSIALQRFRALSAGDALAASVCSAAAEVAFRAFIFISGYARGVRVQGIMGIRGLIFSSREQLFQGGVQSGRIGRSCGAEACVCWCCACAGAVSAFAGCAVVVVVLVLGCELRPWAFVLCS